MDSYGLLLVHGNIPLSGDGAETSDAGGPTCRWVNLARGEAQVAGEFARGLNLQGAADHLPKPQHRCREKRRKTMAQLQLLIHKAWKISSFLHRKRLTAAFSFIPSIASSWWLRLAGVGRETAGVRCGADQSVRPVPGLLTRKQGRRGCCLLGK